MFEDSTFDSTGRIATYSRRWMIAAFAFNTSILLALVLIPLFRPEALPQMVNAFLMEMQAPPVEEVKPPPQPEHATAATTPIRNWFFEAPRVIPKGYGAPEKPEPPAIMNVINLGDEGSGERGPGSPFTGSGTGPDVRPAAQPMQHVSSGVMEGMLIRKVMPEYPSAARAVGLAGTVVLAATISRSGTIENLRVVSGPALLRQAAIDAVREWRYRPYLLNGQPVEVETTVNVEFTLR